MDEEIQNLFGIPRRLHNQLRDAFRRIRSGRAPPDKTPAMTQTAKLTALHGASGDDLGNSVAVSGVTAVAGAPGATIVTKSRQGAAYVFGTQ